MSMSIDRTFERALVVAMTDDVGQPPERLLTAILAETQDVRPLPAVVALVAAPPMAYPARVVVGIPRSRLLLVAAAVLLATAALVAGAVLRRPGPLPDAWSGWGGSSTRAAAAASGPAGVPRVRWTFGASGAIDATPVIVRDLVVVTSRDGMVHAIDLRTGAERWSVALGASIGPPATDGMLVFVEDGGGSIHALRLPDGSTAWTTVILGAPAVDVAVDDGTVYVATQVGTVAALDARDGSSRWRADVAGSSVPVAGIAAAGERVLVATHDARLVALRRDDGTEAWSTPVGTTSPGPPVISDSLVWVGPGDGVRAGDLRAFRLSDGSPAWQAPDPLFAPAVAGSVAISSSDGGIVSARDAATGAEQWRWTPGIQLRPIAIAGDTAYVLAVNERQVYGLDAATGARHWQLPLDARPGCCLAVAQGVMAVGTVSGTVTAFEGDPGAAASGVPSLGATPVASSASPSPLASPAPTLATLPLEVTRRFDAAVFGDGLPLSAAMSDAGDIYVSDTTNHVTRLAPDGTVKRRWGGTGSGEGQFNFGKFEEGTNARGSIAIGPDGSVFVSDADNHRVQVFTAAGDFARTFGSLGSAPGQFTIPFDVTIDDADNAYVLDDGAERITKLAPDGTARWIADHATDPRLAGHQHTATFDSAGRLVVINDDTGTILRLDPQTGRVLDALPVVGCESAVDPWDRIWVLDCTAFRLTLLDPRGRVLTTDTDLRLAHLRLRKDGRGVAVGGDGTVMTVAVTPP